MYQNVTFRYTFRVVFIYFRHMLIFCNRFAIMNYIHVLLFVICLLQQTSSNFDWIWNIHLRNISKTKNSLEKRIGQLERHSWACYYHLMMFKFGLIDRKIVTYERTNTHTHIITYQKQVLSIHPNSIVFFQFVNIFSFTHIFVSS